MSDQPNDIRLHSGELEHLLRLDPEWVAKNATKETPVVITTHAHLDGSPIRALSPHIIFAHGAVLGRCNRLIKAEGVFHEGADFNDCKNLKEIGDLRVVSPNSKGDAASFEGCEKLRTLRGDFNGMVDCSKSGLEKIDVENLVIRQPNREGFAAKFMRCHSLKIAEGKFPGRVDFLQAGIEKIGKLEITLDPSKVTDPKKQVAANFSACPNLRVATGKFPGYVDFALSGVVEIIRLEIDRKAGDFLAGFAMCKQLKSCPEELIPYIMTDEGTIVRLYQTIRDRETARKAMKKSGKDFMEL